MSADDTQLDCDLAIIGGGAAGCALAWEAASRGLDVVLMERSDFGAETSANSLRIVHGGLRYLQTLDVRRARKSAAERSAMLRIAPDLVTPVRCMLPTLPGLARGRVALALGLLANAALTPDRNRGLDARSRLPAGGIATLQRYRDAAPGIHDDGLTGAAFWYDALFTDPERLCLSLALGARRHGARVFNHVEATGVVPDAAAGRCFVSATDRIDGSDRACRARAVADCRGNWLSSLVDGGAHDEARPAVVTAVNLVLRAPLPEHVVGFPERDASGGIVPGRSFFAAPQDGAVAVGTWYFAEPEGTVAVGIDPTRIDQMLTAVNRATSWCVDRDAVLDVQAGLLPRDPASPDDAPMPIDQPCIGVDARDGTGRVWRVQTEKWTTVRQVAEQALDAIAPAAALQPSPSRTATEPLRDAAARHHGTTDVTAAEIRRRIDEEIPRTLDDLVFRRLGFPVWAPPGDDALSKLARMMADALGWSPADIDHNIGRCRQTAARSMLYSARLDDAIEREGASQ